MAKLSKSSLSNVPDGNTFTHAHYDQDMNLVVETLNATDDEIKSNKKEQDGIALRMAAAEQDINTLEERATSSENRLNSAEGRLEAIENTNNQQDNRLNNVEDRATESETRLTSAEGRLESAESKNTEQDNRLTSAEGRVTSSEENISSLEENKTDKTGDHLGTWHGLLPSETKEAQAAQVQANTDKLVVHDQKFENVTTQFENVTAQLAERAYHLNGIDDSVTNNASILNDAIVKSTDKIKNIYIPKGTGKYLFLGDFTLPDGVNLISNGAIIRISGFLKLQGNNTVSGITFDGEYASNGIEVLGSNVNIYNNKFKNFKSTVSGQSNAINLKSVSNVSILNNTFDGFTCYLTTGIDNELVSRAIRVYNGSDIRIKNNVFKNMDNIYDGDYIHVFSDRVVSDTNYPWVNSNGISGYYQVQTGIVIEGNIFYHNKTKSDIKVQESGVIVRGNTFYVTDTFTTSYTTITRVYNAKGYDFIDNKVVVDSPTITDYFNFASVSDLIFERNDIQCKVANSSDVNFIFAFDDVLYPTIANNRLSVYAQGTLYYLNAVKNGSIFNNQITVNPSTLNEIVFVNFKQSVDGDATSNIDISNNEVKSTDVTTKCKITNNAAYSKVSFKSNNFKNITTYFSLTHVDGLKLLNSYFTIQPTYFITLSASINKDIIIKDNTFDLTNWDGISNLNIIRAYTPVTNMVFSRNDTDRYISHTLLNMWYQTSGSQVASEVFYTPGNTPSKLDHGTTTNRNPYKKPINFIYSDTDLSKQIFWVGGGWKDANGTVV